MHIYIYIHTYTWIHISASLSLSLFLSISLYIYMNIHTYIFMCLYIYINIHIYMLFLLFKGFTRTPAVCWESVPRIYLARSWGEHLIWFVHPTDLPRCERHNIFLAALVADLLAELSLAELTSPRGGGGRRASPPTNIFRVFDSKNIFQRSQREHMFRKWNSADSLWVDAGQITSPTSFVT